MKNRWIIVGSSPFIKVIDDWKFLSKYTSIAVNHFNNYDVDYRVANDEKTMLYIIENNLSGKRIFHKNNYHSLIGKLVADKDLLHSQKPYYEYEWAKNITFDDGKLCCRLTSAMAAINFAIKKDAKEIVLIGVDFDWNRGYGKRMSLLNTIKYNLFRKNKKEDYELCEMSAIIGKATRYSNIYRVNPDNKLPLSWLPLMKLEDL